MHKTWIALVVLLGCASFAPHAAAQKMYRCGSTYQDRPCNAAQASQAAGNATASPAPAAPAIDAECRQRGADAQKMAWVREGGQTREQQLEKIDAGRASASRKAYERTLIAEVYAQRGSSAAVRAAIEADCVAAKALGLQAPPERTGIPSVAPAGSGTGERQATQQPVQQSASARESQRRQELCDTLSLQLDDVRNSQRAGGSAAKMESLTRQRQEIEARRSASRC